MSGAPELLFEPNDRGVAHIILNGRAKNMISFAMTHRDMMLDALDSAWDRAYGRCLDHLRRLMPHLVPVLQNQRFIFMGVYISAVLSARQRARRP